MNDSFSRRGFTKLALLGAAGLWLPTRALAQDMPRFAARIEPRVEEQALEVALFLTNQERAGLEVLRSVVNLEGELRKLGGRTYPLAFTTVSVEYGRRSRSGFRIGRKLPFPPNVEITYDRFTAPWPEGTRGGGVAQLVVRAALSVDPEARPVVDRPALRALAQITARTAVTLPR